MPDVDSTNGIYRRIYSGFLASDRFNQVSEVCEAWFWRLHALADDFGNMRIVSWNALSLAASPVREVPAAEAERRTRELVAAGLLKLYTVKGHTFFNVVDFLRFQPAGKNGKRLKRFPTPDEGVSGESGGIRVNPVYPDASSLSKAIQPDESSLSCAIQGTYTPTSTFPSTPTQPNEPKTPPPATGGLLPGLVSDVQPTRRKRTTQPAVPVTLNPDELSPHFNTFWKYYPRKEKKMLAWQTWQRDGMEEHGQKIIDAVRAYRQSEAWTKDDGKYVPHPTTFLNQRMYLDTPKKSMDIYKIPGT